MTADTSQLTPKTNATLTDAIEIQKFVASILGDPNASQRSKALASIAMTHVSSLCEGLRRKGVMTGEGITFHEYKTAAAKILPDSEDALEDFLQSPDTSLLTNLLYATISANGDLANMQEIVKSASFDSHSLDVKRFKESIGHIMTSIAWICASLGCDLEQIMRKNMDSMKKLYPSRFGEIQQLEDNLSDTDK